MTGLRTEDRGRVRLLTLDDPDRHNCLSREMAVGLAEAINGFSRDDEVDVLVITGAGAVSFCSGMDLRGMEEVAEHMTTYPQASLRADRQATIRGDGLPLAEGLKLERDLTAPTAWDAGTAEGLRRYDVGDRPAAPLPR